MSANGISTLGTGTPEQIQEARQIAKLDIAQAKRQGKVVAVDGTITGVIDDTKTYYRYWNVYDRLTLQGPYNVAENLTTNSLPHRPWTTNASGAPMLVGTPTVNTLADASSQPTITGTYDNVNSTSFTVTIDGVTYTLGTDPELTTDGADIWTLDLSGSSQTLATDSTFDVVATSDGTTSDTSTNEVTTVSAIKQLFPMLQQVWKFGMMVVTLHNSNQRIHQMVTVSHNGMTNPTLHIMLIQSGKALQHVQHTKLTNSIHIV